MNIERLKKRIDKYPIISFDIFDTLVKRDVVSPPDVFGLVGTEYNRLHPEKNVRGFKQIRIQKETAVRAKALSEDITLYDIYKAMPYDEIVTQELQKIEMDVEKSVIVANRDMTAAFQYAKTKGKKIIVISEMYLPKVFLKDVLESLGFSGISSYYISSEVGLMKRSGNLFRYAIKDLGVKPSDILHIGDARRSDWIMPIIVGMSVFPIKRHINKLIYYNGYKVKNPQICNISNFIDNHIGGERLYQIGYQTLGPLLFGYCTWLHHLKTEKELRRLLFLARDAQIMQKAYNLIYPQEETEYIYSSRKAITVPFLHFADNWQNLLSVIPHATYMSVESILERVGLKPNDYEGVVTEVGLSLKQSFPLKQLQNDTRFENLYTRIKGDINKNSQKECEGLLIYLNSLHLEEREGIVDLGWKGTIQKYLEKSSEMFHINVKYEGFYMGTFLKQTNAHGYIFNAKDQDEMLAVRGSTGLIESLFAADHGTLNRYTPEGLEFVPFEYYSNEILKKDLMQLKTIQEGALAFVKEYSSFKFSDKEEVVGRDAAFYGLKKLFLHPEKKDLKTFGDMSFYDTNIQCLAKPEIKNYFSLSSFKNAFADSHWKIGFLKRFFGIHLPYMKIYSLLRNYGKQKEENH